MNLHINASSVQIQREVQQVQQFKRAVRKREGIIWDSWVLWVLVHDENGMPGSSGEHLVLMSREGEVIPRSPASPRPFFLFPTPLFLRGRASYCDPHISAAVCSADIKTFGESEDKFADSLLPTRNRCLTKPNSFQSNFTFTTNHKKKSRKTWKNHILPACRLLRMFWLCTPAHWISNETVTMTSKAL